MAASKLLLSRCFLKDSVTRNLQQRVIETSIIIHFDIGYIFHIIENLSNNQTSSKTGNCSRYHSGCYMKERENERERVNLKFKSDMDAGFLTCLKLNHCHNQRI